MKILYFFHREYSPQSGIILAAYLETTVEGQLFYERLEYLTFAVVKELNLTVSFYHEFSRNNRDSLWIRNEDELISDIAKDELNVIDERNYIRFRKAAIAIYKSTDIIDFEILKDNQKK